MSTSCRGFSRAIRVRAERVHLADIRRFVEEVGADISLDLERVFDLKVAVSEACANVVEHAGCETESLEVCARFESPRLTFTVRDTGCFRTPSPAREAFSNRGWGLPLMVALMDEVSFVRSPEGGTCVSLCVLVERSAVAPA
jgi:serine/threonine-protein kinase RsbW